AYVRGAVWQEAGDHGTAALFLKEAARLVPENGNYQALYLNALDKSDPATASRYAEAVLADDANRSATGVIWAANIRFGATRGLSDAEAAPILRGLIAALQRALDRLDDAESGPGSARAMAITLLGFCYDHLGMPTEAAHYYNVG